MRALRIHALAAVLAVAAMAITAGRTSAGQHRRGSDPDRLSHPESAAPVESRRQPDRPASDTGADIDPDVDRPTTDFFARTTREQELTDRAWRAASRGFMRMDKVTYRSLDLEIPAFVFRPLGLHGPRSLPVMVWVHENIRGHFYAHYIPFVREAVAQGYVVIAPEYRGSVGYGKAFFDAIDYGGTEVEDVASAIGALARRFPEIDAGRAGIVGWSHGGLIALLAVTRHPQMFRAAAAIVPVSNLIERLAIKGDRLRASIDPQNRFGGPPARRPEVYKERSPFFQIDRLTIPLLLHAAGNDDDVTPDESRPFIEQLRARKPNLVDIKVYERPFGGHVFDRQVETGSWQPLNTPDQVDSWSRLWQFFGRHLHHDAHDAAAATSPRAATPR